MTKATKEALESLLWKYYWDAKYANSYKMFALYMATYYTIKSMLNEIKD